MSAATAARNTPRLATQGMGFSQRYRPMNGGVAILQGTIVCLDTDGNANPGAATAGFRTEGRAEESVDNTAGVDGAKSVNVLPGTFKWANGTTTSAITAADIGKPCYVIDNQTVGRLSATEARPPAGIVSAVASDGIWVEMSLAISLQIQTLLDTTVVP